MTYSMVNANLPRMKAIGLVILAIITLGVFKSVYRRLVWPLRPLFLFALAASYAALAALALFCAIAHELKVVTEHFEGLRPLLASTEVGVGIFAALYGALFLTLFATLRWYFHERSLAERARGGGERISAWLKKTLFDKTGARS